MWWSGRTYLHCRHGCVYTLPIMFHFMPLRVISVAVWLLPAGCRSVELPPTPAAISTNQQLEQRRTQKFDPFPDTRVGPRVAGLRPPGYRKPISEPARSRQQSKRGRVAEPPVAATPQIGPKSVPSVTLPAK